MFGDLLSHDLQGDEAVLEAKFLTCLKEVRDLRVRVAVSVTAIQRVCWCDRYPASVLV